jgi:hypothetical protein
MTRALPNHQVIPSPSEQHALPTTLAARAKASAARDYSPIWEPPAGSQTPVVIAIEVRCEAAIIDVIERRVDPAEGHLIGNERKERELLELFAALSLHESWEVRRRLVESRPGDRLAASFQRLVIVRRCRLLAFLADAGRRAALAR